MFSLAEINEHRRDALAMMVDTGRAWDPSGSATNPVTGVVEPAFVASDDVGRCQVRGRGTDTAAETVTIGGRSLVVMHGALARPFDSPLLEDGWEWRIETVGAQSDPTLLSRRYRIVRPATAKTWLTARRYDVVEITWERTLP